ncbi:uncharacterized protein METZ01_LOCUS166075, partial [marine metagenome]
MRNSALEALIQELLIGRETVNVVPRPTSLETSM